jgi:hypothetical protein
MTQQRADYDNPWKEALSLYFQPFIAFFFPVIHDNINWERGIALSFVISPLSLVGTNDE